MEAAITERLEIECCDWTKLLDNSQEPVRGLISACLLYTSLVSKGMTPAEENLIRSIPKALAETERVCSSINVGSTKTGLNMDAVRLMGEIVKKTAEATRENDSLGCAKLVVFCNAPDDNPFMAGAFHGVTEADAIINVGVSGPGVVKVALEPVSYTHLDVYKRQVCSNIREVRGSLRHDTDQCDQPLRMEPTQEYH